MKWGKIYAWKDVRSIDLIRCKEQHDPFSQLFFACNRDLLVGDFFVLSELCQVGNFLCLHSQGGIGSGSAQSPRLAALASISAAA